jgi:hypothetical protein
LLELAESIVEEALMALPRAVLHQGRERRRRRWRHAGQDTRGIVGRGGLGCSRWRKREQDDAGDYRQHRRDPNHR